MAEKSPSIDQWLEEAKADPQAGKVGMYLAHNGVVRGDAKEVVRQLGDDTRAVTGMDFSYDAEKVEAAVAEAKTYPGIYYVRVWLNSGHLEVGDDIMKVLVGGDIRERTIDGLIKLVRTIKTTCVVEDEVRG